jgi:hypothetical protein
MTDKIFAGGCSCGQIRYVARGEPVDVRVCHCSICQKANAGQPFARAVFFADAVSVTGETTSYPSSERTVRHFCARCGQHMFGRTTYDPVRLGISLASLDEPGALKPDMHFWVSDDPTAALLADGLPQYEQFPPDYAKRLAPKTD